MGSRRSPIHKISSEIARLDVSAQNCCVQHPQTNHLARFYLKGVLILLLHVLHFGNTFEMVAGGNSMMRVVSMGLFGHSEK